MQVNSDYEVMFDPDHSQNATGRETHVQPLERKCERSSGSNTLLSETPG